MIRSTLIEPSAMQQSERTPQPKDDPKLLKQAAVAFKKRAETAEQKLAVAKKELVTLLTKTEGEQDARAQELERELKDLQAQHQLQSGEIERLTEKTEGWRQQCLEAEKAQADLQEQLERARLRLSQASQPVPVEDRDPGAPTSVYVDALTKLGNEVELQRQLRKTLLRSQSGQCLSVLMVFDVDRFANVNELGGWECGNEFLVEVGQRLQKLTGGATPVCRRGEDEFAVLIELDRPKTQVLGSEGSRLQARQFAEMLMRQFDGPFTIAGRSSKVGVSMGISLAPDDADSPSELLENAHLALAQAKRQGGAGYRFFSDGLHEAKELRVGRSMEFERALEERAFQTLFAPIVDVESGTLAGAELELYWNHERYGRLGLAEVTELAEELGRATELFEYELASAAELSRKLRGSVPVVVAVPATVLGADSFVKQTLETIGSHRLKPEGFTLEIDAQSGNAHSAHTAQVFRELAHWRVGRSVGGLGAGPLPLNLLSEGLPSQASLDPRTMQGVPGDPGPTRLVQGLIKLFRELGVPLRITAVEDKSQAHFLANYEAQLASGRYLLPGMTIDDLLARKRTTWSFR